MSRSKQSPNSDHKSCDLSLKMDGPFDDNSSEQQMPILYNGLNEKLNEFKNIFGQIVFENSHLKEETHKLKDDNKQLLAELQLKNSEVEVLTQEIMSLNEERENMRKELREVRNENDLILSRLNKRDSVTETAMEFAKRLLQTNYNLNVNGIVNSLPAFSEQMVLSERPNSMTTLGSLVDMEGLRLRPSESKEDTYHSTKLASVQTSNETYYDAIASHRSSLTNGSTGVRPKVQQNQVSSTVLTPKTNVTEILNETMQTDSTNFYIDDNNNLRLKLVKVPIARLMTVSMAFSTSPSDFWLHINPIEVNNFIHVIQVKQNELKSQPNTSLTAADIELGMYCASIYSGDGYWYRAQIIGITYDHNIERDSIKSVNILFIDWGNSEERSLSQIMKLALELNERRQAVNCYIQGNCCGHRTKWPQKSIQDFEDMIKNQRLKATFNKPHKVNEVLDSIVYPIDLMCETEGGVFANLNDVLVIPEVIEEEDDLNNMVLNIEQYNHLNGQSADTVICNGHLSGQSNPTLPTTQSKCESKQKGLEKSKSNQNCTEHTNGVPESTNSTQKSMPQLNGYPLSDHNLSDKHRIPPPIIPDTTEGLIVETSYLASPSYMYLHIRDAQVGNAQFEDLEESLNGFYSKRKIYYSTQPNEVKCGSFWANRFGRDNRWYRCRVIEVDKDRALVNYVDWGNEEWTEIQGLMPLTRQFANYPSMAVKCRLSNVFPIGSEEWSEESLEYFGDLIANENTPPLTAFIAQKPTNFDFDSFLEVFLWTIDANNEDVLVNLQLVLNNYAVTDHFEWVKEAERGLREKTPPELMSELIPIINNINVETTVLQSPAHTPKVSADSSVDLVNGVFPPVESYVPNGDVPLLSKSTNEVKIMPDLPSVYSDDEEWDPIAEDAACDLNSYNIRPNDPGIATVGFRAEDRKTCKYYGTSRGCRAKDYCSFLHVDPEKRFALDDNEEEIIDVEELELQVNSIVIFKLTSVVSPYHFYGVLPYGPINLETTEIEDDAPQDKQLKELCSLLKNKYSKAKAENVNIYPGTGSLVAFREEETDTYYRGRVIEPNYDEKTCTLFCVDLGIEMDVKRTHIFKLSNYFCQFPALAIECSLTGIQPLSSVGWSTESIDSFNDWLSDRLVCAKIMYGKTEGKHYVELIVREEEEEEEYYISKRLVESKLAQSVQSCPPSNDLEDEIYNSDLD